MQPDYHRRCIDAEKALERIAQAVQCHADPGAADSQPDGDRNAAQHQCFVQNTVADLPPGRADGFQQAKLLRPLCHRDGEGIID